jgi:hypothetical protein
VPRRYLVHIAPFWVLALILGSLLPGPAKHVLGISTRYSLARGGQIRWQHHLAHFLSFGSTTGLLLLIARTRSQDGIVLLGMLILGLSLEYTQHVLYETEGMEWWDVRDDSYADVVVYLAGQWRPLKAALVRDPE